MDRRTFTRTAGTALLGSSLAPYLRTTATWASDQIRVGLIGANGMGWSNMTNLLGDEAVSCVAIADVDARVLDRRLKDYTEQRSNTVATYADKWPSIRKHCTKAMESAASFIDGGKRPTG